MSARVYVTQGGAKYHYTKTCSLLTSAQELSDWDCPDDWCHGHQHPRIHAVELVSASAAALRGKLPCLNCVPDFLKMFAVQDFGHHPVNEYTDGRATHIVCARCMRWTRWADVSLHVGVRITWPCTSAIVLGLVSRGRGKPPAL